MASNREIEKSNGQAYFKGSRHVQFLGHDFYLHDTYFVMTVYKGTKIIENTAFTSPIEMQENFDKLKAKIGYKSNRDIPQGHALKKGVVLVHNTDVNSPLRNKIRFFQVVEVMEDMKIKLREIQAEVFTHGNYSSCIPMPGMFVKNSELVEKTVIANSVDIGEGIAVRLEYTNETILSDSNGKPLIQIKKYKKSEFGLKCQ